MSDDPTKDIPDVQSEDKNIELSHDAERYEQMRFESDPLNVIREIVSSLAKQIRRLDETLNQRLSTRPLWAEAMQQQLTEMRAEMQAGFKKLDRRLDVVTGEVIDIKDTQRGLETRVEKLEEKAS
jgi:flagellar motor switch protein FliM